MNDIEEELLGPEGFVRAVTAEVDVKDVDTLRLDYAAQISSFADVDALRLDSDAPVEFSARQVERGVIPAERDARDHVESLYRRQTRLAQRAVDALAGDAGDATPA